MGRAASLAAALPLLILPLLLPLLLSPAVAGEEGPVFEGKTVAEWADAIEKRGDFLGWGKGISMPPSEALLRGGDEAFPVVRALVGHERPRVRALVADHVLGRSSPRARDLIADPRAARAARLLLGLLEDDAEEVRNAVIAALERLEFYSRMNFRLPDRDTMATDVANSTVMMGDPRPGPILRVATKRIREVAPDRPEEVADADTPTEELIEELFRTQRFRAGYLLGALASRKDQADVVLPAIRRALAERADVPLEALGALGELGPRAAEALPEVRKHMLEGHPAERPVAAFAVWRITGDPAEPLGVLDGLLRRSDGRVVLRAVWAAAQMGAAAAPLAPKLEALLDHGVSSVRQYALQGFRLASDDRDAVVAAHVRALSDPDVYVTLTAARGLTLLGDIPDAARPGLTAMLGESLIYANAWATRALGLMGPAAAGSAPELGENLAHATTSVRLEAARALRRIGPAGVAEIVAALDRPEAFVRGEAAGALAAVEEAGEEVRAALREALSDPSHYVRVEAAVALAVLAPEDSAPIATLLAAARDEDRFRREWGAEGLLRLGPERVRGWAPSLLSPGVEEAIPVLRALAALPSAQLGPLREELRELAADPDPDVSLAAARLDHLLDTVR